MSAHHPAPVRTYLAVFGALLALTALTTWIAFQDLGALNTPIALAVASLKVLIVVLYFMHVKGSSKLVKVMAATGFLWLLILFVLLMGDFRTRIPVEGWLR